ncbi:MAG: MG2 domain protein [Cenarchaeum symbiont of Oopsacas minuta]|nr:MG2 domain protein [Cenarchaeum symbiont of Oopsacas minuta]
MMSQRMFGLVLATTVVLFAVPSVSESWAQVEVSSESIDTSVILTVENSDGVPIRSFSIWLDSGDFRSYKINNNWIASINPAGILTFTAATVLEPNTSIQFGIHTDSEYFKINWNAFDINGNTVGSGVILDERPVEPVTPPDIDDEQLLKDNAITNYTELRIVPERPNVGGTIRIVASGLVSGESVDFYIDTKFIGTYTASNDGRILDTAHIPNDIKADRTNFIIIDSQDNRKDLSIRLGTANTETPKDDIQNILIFGPTEVLPSKITEFSGTAKQNSYIVVTVLTSESIPLESKIIETNSIGEWIHNVLVQSDLPTGSYMIKATDGRITESRLFTVSDVQVINIAPTLLKFKPGDVMAFTGTVHPDYPVEVIITDPRNNEVYSDVVLPDSNGNVRIEFTTTHSDPEGTYALLVSQNSITAVILGGLGEFAKESIVLHLDKINYRSSESVNAFIDAKPNSHISIIVLDNSNREKFEDHVTIGPSGKLNYPLDLGGYPSGVYTMIATKATTETEVNFGVNIVYGTGLITIMTTKSTYVQGSEIFVLGDIETTTQVLLDLSLLDSDGNIVRTKQIFSGSGSLNGKISDNTFRIPPNAVTGQWTIRAQSGEANIGDAVFNVVAAMNTDTQIYATVLNDNILRITGVNIPDLQSVQLIIYTTTGESLHELDAQVISSGTFETYWDIPAGLPSGSYIVKIDSLESETQFILE